MTWLSKIPAGTVLHVIDRRRSRAIPICGADSGLCVSSEDATCPDCKRVLEGR